MCKIIIGIGTIKFCHHKRKQCMTLHILHPCNPIETLDFFVTAVIGKIDVIVNLKPSALLEMTFD